VPLTVADIEAEYAALEKKRAEAVAARDAAVQAVLKCDGALMLAKHLLVKLAGQPAPAAPESDPA
jgi:hypothetical protein